MIHYPGSIQRAIQALSRLPGVGTKTAERLVFFLLRMPKDAKLELTRALDQLNGATAVCKECGYVTDSEDQLCIFCKDTARDKLLICVVPEIQHVQSIEKSGAFHGRYHVLGGSINPIEGISVDMLAIPQLLSRIKNAKPHIKEIILATGTTIEGEQTSLYVLKLLKQFPLIISRPATGIPRGSDLDYADELTLADAIKARRKV